MRTIKEIKERIKEYENSIKELNYKERTCTKFRYNSYEADKLMIWLKLKELKWIIGKE